MFSFVQVQQQANISCRALAQEGLVSRRQVLGKIHNLWIGQEATIALPSQPVSQMTANPHLPPHYKSDNWFWEGNVQDQVVRYLQAHKWAIRSCADTASHQRGKDIIAKRNGSELWVPVKGYPTGTKRTHATVQAGHWFKGAVFDIIRYRGENERALLGIALPDFPRYHRLAETIRWLEPVASFVYYWVQPTGEITHD